MKKFLCLIILMGLAAFCVSCADNIKINDEDEPIAKIEVKFSTVNAESPQKEVNVEFSDDKPIFLALSAFGNDEDIQCLQMVDVTDPKNPKIADVQTFKAVDEHSDQESLSFVGICGNYICIQSDWMGLVHDKSEKPDEFDEYNSVSMEYRHTLSLYNINDFNFSKPIDTVTFDERKGTAFYTIGNHIFIGGYGRVSLATIENGKIKVEKIYKFEPVWVHKSIDVFVRVKNKLLAIDDVQHPFYGFVFDIEDVSKPKYIKTIQLPDYTNTHYMAAVHKDETIYALTEYGIRYSEGQNIVSFNLEKEDCETTDLYYGRISREMSDPEVEHIYGDFNPYLKDMHILGDKFVFAGMDGIVTLPINPKDAECVVHKFKWHIASIAIFDNVVFALMKIDPENSRGYKVQAKLLTLKYDEQKGKFIIANSVDVDNRVNQIHTN